ncbi:response regulator transcription factor [Trichococcus paludicola]|uniref:response regulator transcription factor n=1 Tax=Trichococcus paludicola TaxID=2052942 RepID=UPI000D342E1A|nr:response regulator transcription factor [Trichococcus paludicola]
MDRKKTRVLVVDDEQSIRDFLTMGLEDEGYSVETAKDGLTALTKMHDNPFNIVILDVMMPGMDGYECCRMLKQKYDVVVIMLTAKDQAEDTVKGLKTGADDYLAKPFSFLELLTRMEVRLTSRFPQKNIVIRKGPFSVDDARHEITFENEKLDLTPTEYKLMCLLFDNVNIVISKETIMNKVWGYDYFSSSNVVEVYIRNLREKLQDTSHRYIKTERGFGYKLDVEG